MSTEENKKEVPDIDDEITKAISTISELEEWIKKLSNEKGMISIEKESPIKGKFNQLHKEFQLLTLALVEKGLLDTEDIEDLLE